MHAKGLQAFNAEAARALRNAPVTCESRTVHPRVCGDACADAASKSANPVHPRVCGERIDPRAWTTEYDGSSPRVRGTHRKRQRVLQASAVHPRVCGERHHEPLRHFLDGGSSPRVRGTLCGPITIGFSLRFIPACAGNAVPAARSCARQSVHPRVCGERLSVHVPESPSDGSSPRVRGTPLRLRRYFPRLRFIPACAGNA